MERLSGNPIKSPEGWVKTTLGEILSESKEKFYPNKSSNKKYIGLEHIEKDTGSLNGYGNSSEILSTKNTFNNGDLLYGKLRPYLNKAAVPDFDGVCSTDILVFKKHDHLFNNFIKYRLLSRDFVNFAQLNVSGVQHPRINKKLIDTFSIYFPPLAEQHQIVSKIEELFSELDNGIESLKKAREQLKTYRQAVLKYAFEGKMTQEWREQQIQAGNPPEPAEKLLERIKKEREAHYQNQVEEWKKACEQAKKDGSKKLARPKKPKDLPPLTKRELADLPELPEGWGWCRAGELFSYVTSGSRGWAKYYSTDGAIFIRIANLDFDSLKIDLNDNNIQYVAPPANSEGTRTKIKAGDFLFSITGYLGMFAIAPKLNSSAYINQHIALARPLDCFEKKYVGYYCISKTGGFYCLNKSQKGATKAGLTLDDIRLFPVPICSISEQVRVVSEIETRLSVCDQLEQTIEDSLKKAEALRQSILKKAFEGELTREWRLAYPELISGENSAESLLARIREEKARLNEDGKKRRSGKIRK